MNEYMDENIIIGIVAVIVIIVIIKTIFVVSRFILKLVLIGIILLILLAMFALFFMGGNNQDLSTQLKQMGKDIKGTLIEQPKDSNGKL